MVVNPEAEQFFLSRSAHDGVGTALLESLKPLGEYELRGELRQYKSPYAVTANIVFCGAARRRLVRIALFRPNWPKPDLGHWALRAYSYARTGG